jgi:hypothetical protein
MADAVDFLRRLPDGCLDAVLCDPPYPEIDRPYGRLTEAEWHTLMHALVPEARRALKPSGSAMFVLQPNSRKVGSMRPWLWEFLAWCCREWNVVQDVWWWNPTSPPTVHCHRTNGLMRRVSRRVCGWVRPTAIAVKRLSCGPNRRNMALNAVQTAFCTVTRAATHARHGRCREVVDERGGVTPFNLFPFRIPTVLERW